MLETVIVEAPQLDGGNEVWIEALPAKIFHTPQYGPVPISHEKLQRMIRNFNDRVRGQEIATDFDHGMDRAKGNQASGWFKELAIKPASDDPTLPALYARVELTDDAASELRQKKWRYFSLEWDDEWLDNEGRLWTDVITGGGLTNRPIAKKTMPINFSEALWDSLDYDTKKEFAVWSTKFINDLPDSSFLYIEPGGKKDGEGKTIPRSKRHFPYKGTGGKVDLPHLRNAIARIPQAGAWMSESLKKSVQSRARRLLAAAGKAMSETTSPDVREAFDTLMEAGFDVEIAAELVTKDESKEWEHSEPGTGTPPQPRTDEDGSDDIAIREGWRVDTPAIERDEPNRESRTTTNPTSESGTTTSGGEGTSDGGTVGEDSNTETTDNTVRSTATGNNEEASTTETAETEDTTSTTDDTRTEEVTATTSSTEERQETTTEEKVTKGGNVDTTITSEQEFELRNILGLDAKGDVVEAARLQLGELTELRRSVDAVSQEKKFAEEYPAYWAEHNKLMDRDRTNSARAFSESVQRIRKAEGYGLKETAKGLSTMALTKITEVHKKFSEGQATVEDFEDVIRTITNGGIVEFGEIGTSNGDGDDVPLFDTTTAGGVASARKAFAEVISKIQRENDGMDYKTAMSEAARKHPDLAEAYNVALPA